MSDDAKAASGLVRPVLLVAAVIALSAAVFMAMDLIGDLIGKNWGPMARWYAALSIFVTGLMAWAGCFRKCGDAQKPSPMTPKKEA